MPRGVLFDIERFWGIAFVMMDDQRAVRRNRTLKAGMIDFGLGGFECTVRNVSAQGALVEVADPWALPDRFNLAIPSEGLRRPCRIVWRGARRLGIAFIA